MKLKSGILESPSLFKPLLLMLDESTPWTAQIFASLQLPVSVMCGFGIWGECKSPSNVANRACNIKRGLFASLLRMTVRSSYYHYLACSSSLRPWILFNLLLSTLSKGKVMLLVRQKVVSPWNTSMWRVKIKNTLSNVIVFNLTASNIAILYMPWHSIHLPGNSPQVEEMEVSWCGMVVFVVNYCWCVNMTQGLTYSWYFVFSYHLYCPPFLKLALIVVFVRFLFPSVAALSFNSSGTMLAIAASNAYDVEKDAPPRRHQIYIQPVTDNDVARWSKVWVSRNLIETKLLYSINCLGMMRSGYEGGWWGRGSSIEYCLRVKRFKSVPVEERVVLAGNMNCSR